jgi:trehalose synthase-fused probable maltokinase
MTQSSAARALSAFTPDWWQSRRWYAGKNRRLVDVVLVDEAELSSDPPITLMLLQLAYAEGPPDMYALPVLFATDGSASDALEHAEYHRLLLRLLSENARRGPVSFEAFTGLSWAEPRLLGVEQSNTSIAYGEQWMLKNLRRVAFGQNRDLEVGRFLSRRVHFQHTPEVVGAITYQGKGAATLGVLQRFVKNDGDGWGFFLSHLRPVPNAPDDLYWAQAGLPDDHERLLNEAQRLGRITGEMHAALGSRSDVPEFAPEAVGEADRQAWLADVEYQLACAAGPLGDRVERYRVRLRRLASELPLEGISKIQIHGDYHLGNVLKTPDGYAIIDFEGEPARPLEQRRAKALALRDVAGMLRSLDYAAHGAGLPAEYAAGWSKAAGERFLAGWQQTAGRQGAAGEACLRLVSFFATAKALYELNYELNNRPEWVSVPLGGIERLLSEARP